MAVSKKATDAETRRQFLIDTARGLFATQGIENTSMNDIASAADYTRRTLYSYFRNFDEICLLVLLEDQATRWEMQKSAISAEQSGLAKLRAWAETLYHFVRENPQYAHLETYWDFHGLNARMVGRSLFARFKRQNNELADGLREIFQTGIEDGSMRPDLQIDMCISQFLYSLRAILHRALSPAYSFAHFDTDEYIQHYLNLFSRAIRNQRETSG